MEGTANNSIGVKLTYEGQMRRFPFTGGSYAAFYEQIVALLGLDTTANISLKYTDDEGDHITISSDLELRSALVPGQLLRINVVSKNVATPMLLDQPPQHTPQEFFGGAPAFRAHPHPHPHSHGHPPHGPHGHPHGRPHHTHGHPHPPHAHGPHGHAHGFPAPPPGFAPFGAFKHGCGREGDKWNKKIEKLEKEGKFDKIEKIKEKMEKHEKMEQKKHKKMAERGFPPHMTGPYHPYPPHMSPHHHHHKHHKKDAKKDGKDSKEVKLTARYVTDVTIEDGSKLAPLTPFVKTWRMRNEGPTPWPAGCGLLFISKKSHDLSSPTFVPVGEIGVGVEVNISVNLVAPISAGRYTGYWRLSTADGRKFGQRVWTSIVVPGTTPMTQTNSSEEEREADKYEALVDVVLRNETFRGLGIKRHWVFRLLQKSDGDVDKVQAYLNKKIEKKLNKGKM